MTATNTPPNPGLTVVAMSGGVDSSTVAAMLRDAGAPIVGLTMQLWDHRRFGAEPAEPAGQRCCSLDDVHDARRVAEHLGFPHYVVNFERQFEETVVRPFAEDYLAGRTPIPCTLCNNHVKFGQLMVTARQIGASRIATGHYARIRRNDVTGRCELLRATDASKDQSYFLFGLTQEQLAFAHFPLGELSKETVREMARAARLPVCEKPESQEICFVPSGDYAAFIDAYLSQPSAEGMPPSGHRLPQNAASPRVEPLEGCHSEEPEATRNLLFPAERAAISTSSASGELVTTSGEVLGGHDGVHHFTVGQRRGLGVSRGKPLYVVQIDAPARRVIVGDEAELRRDACGVRGVNWIAWELPPASFEAQVKIRYRHEPAPAIVEPTGADSATVRFLAPQRAITPGQSAVFYDGDRVLGGGWILGG